MLRDLEETLLRIPARDAREFMGEAVRCYHAGAHRAAIVIAVAVGMDDLRKKLAAQAGGGGAPQAVKDLSNAIDGMFNAQAAFEGALIDGCEHVANILTPSEATKLSLLLKLRHLCAHPSGHAATPEEAREAITSITDLILVRPGQLGMAAVAALLERLNSPMFFPNATPLATIAQAEIGGLQPALYRALAARLVEKVLTEAAAAHPPTILNMTPTPGRDNSVRFLCGLLGVAEPAVHEAVWAYVGRLIEGPATSSDALRVMAAAPAGITGAPSLTRHRAVELARRNLRTSDARQIIRAWRAAGILTADELADISASATQQLLGKLFPTTPGAIAELGMPEIEAAFFAKAADDAGSGNFTTSNDAVSAMQALTPDAVARVPPDLQVQYLLNVSNSSNGEPYHGMEARRVVTGQLAGCGPFVDALGAYATNAPVELRSKSVMWEQTAKLLHNNGRDDVLLVVLGAFANHEGEHYPTFVEMLEYCGGLPATNELANAMIARRREARQAQAQNVDALF